MHIYPGQSKDTPFLFTLVEVPKAFCLACISHSRPLLLTSERNIFVTHCFDFQFLNSPFRYKNLLFYFDIYQIR